jgi:hypothetical protein
LGAAGGLLVVPEGAQVVAYGSAADAGAAVSRDGGGDGGCAWAMAKGQEPASGYYPTSVAIGDLNGDGRPDVAVANFNSNPNVVPFNVGTVSVLIGNGDGTFQSRVDYPTDVGTNAVAIADLNSDGRADSRSSTADSASGSTRRRRCERALRERRRDFRATSGLRPACTRRRCPSTT